MIAELKNFFKNTFNYNGYASRSEFTAMLIITFLVGILMSVFSFVPHVDDILIVISFIWMIPMITLTMRRFHDAGISIIMALVVTILPSVIDVVPIGNLFQEIIEFVCLATALGIGIFKPTKQTKQKSA